MPGRASAVPVGVPHRAGRHQQGLGVAISAARAGGRSFPNSRAATMAAFANQTFASKTLPPSLGVSAIALNFPRRRVIELAVVSMLLERVVIVKRCKEQLNRTCVRVSSFVRIRLPRSGDGLITERLELGLTADQVAGQLLWSPAKISRIETAIRPLAVKGLRLRVIKAGFGDPPAAWVTSLDMMSGAAPWWSFSAPTVRARPAPSGTDPGNWLAARGRTRRTMPTTPGGRPR